MLRLPGNSSTSSAAGIMRLKRLIKPPAQPVVLDSDLSFVFKYINNNHLSVYHCLAIFLYIKKAAHFCAVGWSERRESNPRESAWEADAIPLGDSRI